MKHHRIRTTYDSRFKCISCGGIRSDRSINYCFGCNKKRIRINIREDTGGVNKSSDWTYDDLGNPTRLHGDVSK